MCKEVEFLSYMLNERGVHLYQFISMLLNLASVRQHLLIKNGHHSATMQVETISISILHRRASTTSLGR